ncbi:hypothetical protein [Celerinatantimonas sp. MCCC 1A17872]|uniref:hypothetical protein n=1 Tax=Celerinatantimonas sp. MCCC 1A17872 TaxID=3177514 RepID=UPI0038C3AF2C
MQYLKKIIIANIITAIIVAILSHFVPALRVASIGDFCFEMVIILWGIAVISWRGGAFMRRANEMKAIRKKRQLPLVDGEQEKATQINNKGGVDYTSELVLFASGVPAALVCIISALVHTYA